MRLRQIATTSCSAGSAAGTEPNYEATPAKENSSLRRRAWKDISSRFCDHRECLAAYLALESAEVIVGVKPANLISIQNRTHACGSNLYQSWHLWGSGIIKAAGMESYTLTDRGNAALVMLYRPDDLAGLLATPAVRAILRRAGYPEHSNAKTLFAELAGRMENGAFPHEIGMFLGYPLKDVAGFMGLAKIPFACQGPWKIYGAPGASLKLAETFRQCRGWMVEKLATCASPFECFGHCTQGSTVFCQSTDNGLQLHKHGTT